MRRTGVVAALMLCSILCLLACTKEPQPPSHGVRAEIASSFPDPLSKVTQEARASWPKAKEKFLKGLQEGYRLLVTTRIANEVGYYDYALIDVKELIDAKISGQIVRMESKNRIYGIGAPYSLQESDLLDWMVLGPNGYEEGNYFGEYYRKQGMQPKW